MVCSQCFSLREGEGAKGYDWSFISSNSTDCNNSTYCSLLASSVSAEANSFDEMFTLPLLLLMIPSWTLFHTLGCPSRAWMSAPSYIFDHTLFAFVSVLVLCLFCCISFLSFSCKLCRIDLQSNQNRNAGSYFAWQQAAPKAIPACFPRAMEMRCFIDTKSVLLCSLPILIIPDECSRSSVDLGSLQEQWVYMQMWYYSTELLLSL